MVAWEPVSPGTLFSYFIYVNYMILVLKNSLYVVLLWQKRSRSSQSYNEFLAIF